MNRPIDEPRRRRTFARTYAFVALERIGGVVVLDVSRPTSPSFVTYFASRENVAASLGADQGPEGVVFVPAKASPTGHPMLLVGNEVSGTVSIIGLSA